MAIAFEQSAAPKSGSDKISELADAWVVMAVKSVLKPDEGRVLEVAAGMLRALAEGGRVERARG